MITRGERPEFTSDRVSPSRLNSYVSCGVAFKKQYIDRVSSERSGSAALFGNVVHAALEKWALNRQADLVSLMRAAWLECTAGTVVAEFLGAYGALSAQSIRAKHECRIAFEIRTKKPSQAIEMSGEWKAHPVKKKLDILLREWIPKLDHSPWLFTERDRVFSLYDESLVLAARYQHGNRSRPNALFTELAFDVKWNGFYLNGHIDAVEAGRLAGGFLSRLDVVDYKTYRVCDAEAKDWRQGVIYDVAVRELLVTERLAIEGVSLDYAVHIPINVVFDYPRLNKRRRYVMTDVDHSKMLHELQMYKAGVEAGVFMPAEKGRNLDYCDYPEDCCLRNRGGCAMPIEED